MAVDLDADCEALDSLVPLGLCGRTSPDCCALLLERESSAAPFTCEFPLLLWRSDLSC